MGIIYIFTIDLIFHLKDHYCCSNLYEKVILFISSRWDSLTSTSTASTDGINGQYNSGTISSTNEVTDTDDTTSAASTDIW